MMIPTPGPKRPRLWDHPPAGFFFGPKEADDVSVRLPLSPGNPPRARRATALELRGNLGSALSHARFRLRQRRREIGALQGRGSGLPLFALLQSDRRDV